MIRELDLKLELNWTCPNTSSTFGSHAEGEGGEVFGIRIGRSESVRVQVRFRVRGAEFESELEFGLPSSSSTSTSSLSSNC